MLPTMSATEIADKIADNDRLSEEEHVSLRVRMKQVTSKRDFLRPVENPNAAPNSKKRYPRLELARAAILTDAILVGFESAALITVAEALERPPVVDISHAPSASIDGAFFYPNGLESAVRGINANDPGRWFLTFSCGRNHETRKPVWAAFVTYQKETDERSDAGLYTNPFRHPIIRGEFDLTERLTPFAWMLKE
ncbi:hypothetical protein [Rhizobium rhizogenes]|uniref:hypothetical protein n=1 Tax=Rhizobium rhizogenes TaxID=359 RepID=UPI0022CCC635|nr:hypothetical protein [Rhizobium rhizogenes]MCZ7484499.1 hypothetical protein [Rhizobium rhizogenes]